MSKAQIIAEQITAGIKLSEILQEHEFTTSLALGQYMYQQGYRFSPEDHCYYYEETLLNQQLSLPLTQINIRERLSEARLIEALEIQVKTMRDLLNGATPVMLSPTTQRQLITYCEINHLSVDTFIEAAILDKLITT